MKGHAKVYLGSIVAASVLAVLPHVLESSPNLDEASLFTVMMWAFIVFGMPPSLLLLLLGFPSGNKPDIFLMAVFYYALLFSPILFYPRVLKKNLSRRRAIAKIFILILVLHLGLIFSYFGYVN